MSACSELPSMKITPRAASSAQASTLATGVSSNMLSEGSAISVICSASHGVATAKKSIPCP